MEQLRHVLLVPLLVQHVLHQLENVHHVLLVIDLHQVQEHVLNVLLEQHQQVEQFHHVLYVLQEVIQKQEHQDVQNVDLEHIKD